MESIAAAENSRQVNPAGVQRLTESIKSKGFMATTPPQIMFLDIGEDEHLAQDMVDNKLRAIYIDGSRRQGDNFTCNEKVIPQKFDGMLRTSEGKHDPNTAAASVMTAVPYLGAKKRFSDDVAVWVN
ncbi:expressed unknown protein [Ectocarpus siliculosus]|uniref:Uncharacterized protein n=1 Tax=Ectocarpus siliculosus TaxID=2880 RepID=D7FXI3_ECTSI|nr:expressed unknown protein [Ectocarpus siliculosus]|eukprot:CBJ32320.1 expressed unknown protein [Ectocarpus siliculosus]